MSKFKIMTAFLLLANLGCASERLYVKVVDDEGSPVANAVVKVGFSDSHVLLGGGHRSGASSGGNAEARTDTNGNAVVKFNCQSSDFGWHVEADGYYRSESHKEHFEGEDVVVPPAIGFVKLHEHEKRGEAVLYRKKDPQPMYAYTREMGVKSPIANGRYGFDLECFDWLPPYGKGSVADFYYVRERPDETNMTVKARWRQSSFFAFKNGEPGYPKLGDVIGRIEFDENCGAYIGKQTGCSSFPTLYRADPNQEYLRSFPITIRGNDGHTVWLEESDVVNCGEYMVIRSRVKCDENGNIVSAHYSKILGPWGIGALMCPYEAVFNPRPNDTNLEFDPARNLYQGKKGRGMIP
ncbi:MAG: hypothetical protein IKU71_11190 [Kiritimatiellae bacterium]|nr:hypothetical protein [Kiritimatiellia bacterium]